MTRAVFMIIAVALAGFGARAQEATYEREPINDLKARPTDPVARLAERIESGKVRLEQDVETGYLSSLLAALEVPRSSQVLVFSKTSLQHHRIYPSRPRAIYFNDGVYVGFVRGGDVIEVTATDPVNGPMFYTVRQDEPGRPLIARETDACLQCHAASATAQVPGHLVRSVFPTTEGQPILSAGTFRTTPSSPLKQRWGGWYVTGTSGAQVHMGNVVSKDKDDPESTDFTAGTNVTALDDKFDTSAYLTPHSDIVALMVMEHQAHVHNLITRASYLTRQALHDAREMNKALGRPTDYKSESTLSRIRNAGEPLVKGLLFCEEAALTDAIKGTSGFAEEFAKRGPRDGRGRSLREFDLKARMFKYPLSYLVYSEAFDGLPTEVQGYVYERLGAVLTGAEQGKEFGHLSAEDRGAILEIVRGTKKGLPASWGK